MPGCLDSLLASIHAAPAVSCEIVVIDNGFSDRKARKSIDMTSLALATTDAALFEQHAQAIDACLDRYIPAGRPVALLQFPYGFNVGNHMMWLAAADYLKRRDARIAYAAHGHNFNLDAMKRVVGDGVILFLGGVTVSRLWPRHAEVKRIVAAACPSNRFI